MHPNAQLLDNLFAALNAHNHAAMAACYDDDASFSDIAFRLRGKKHIHAMWHIVCNTDIQTAVKDVAGNDDEGRATIVDNYTFSDTGRCVCNEIESQFKFKRGLITEHHDVCDPLKWARQAFGGIKGEIAGRIELLRRVAAQKKIRKIKSEHPEYR